MHSKRQSYSSKLLLHVVMDCVDYGSNEAGLSQVEPRDENSALLVRLDNESGTKIHNLDAFLAISLYDEVVECLIP